MARLGMMDENFMAGRGEQWSVDSYKPLAVSQTILLKIEKCQLKNANC
jgi:hypothetical protein